MKVNTTIAKTRQPKSSQGGAPQGNRNATKHGIRGFLTIGSLPKGASYIRKLIGQFSRHLEETVADRYGEIDVYRAALIQSASRHEARAQLLTRWLRHESNLSYADRVSTLREIGSASDSRDKTLKMLGLDRMESQDAVSDLYGDSLTPADFHDNEPADSTDDAAGATTERDTGEPQNDDCEPET